MAITQYVSIATIPLLIILSALIAVWIKSRRNRRPPQISINVRVEDQTTTKEGEPSLKPISVNYHLTRQCNYKCGFCFHTAKTSFVLPIEEAKKGLTLLKNDGIISLLYIFRVCVCAGRGGGLSRLAERYISRIHVCAGWGCISSGRELKIGLG